MSDTVKFKLRIVKYLEPMTHLSSEPTGIRKNISTVYENLTSVSDIVSKIKEFFSEETCIKISKSGNTLTYNDESNITIDEEELTERIEGYFNNIAKYGVASWSQTFDSQGGMEGNWEDDTKYIAQLIITEPKEEVPVIIYPQEYPNA